MTAVEKAQKAAEKEAAAHPSKDTGRIPCPCCGYSMNYQVEHGQPTWVACTNPECEVQREQRAALKVGSCYGCKASPGACHELGCFVARSL